ncbi:MAG: hypothetical protein AAFR31_05800 [Cyanobacteria bacterium J06627_8]
MFGIKLAIASTSQTIYREIYDPSMLNFDAFELTICIMAYETL